jgi:type 1 glutamine amidotransferase
MPVIAHRQSERVAKLESRGRQIMGTSKTLSRRGLVQGASLVAGAGLIGAAGSQDARSQTRRGKPRVLALVGDRYHNPDYIRTSLDPVFKALDIPIDYTIAYDQISAAMLKNYQVFLTFRDGMIWPGGYLGPDASSYYAENLENPKTFPDPVSQPCLTQEQGAAIKDFVNAGGGLYAMHNSSYISLYVKGYRDVMGGVSKAHPPLRPFQVRATQNRHPITEGIKPFMVNDEQHYVQYDLDPAHIILESENIDGLTFRDMGTKSVSGWAHDFGKGRVVFTAVGHNTHALWNPQYLELQKRSVRWLLRQI